MIVINLDQQSQWIDPNGGSFGWNFTISGATTGNGSYSNNYQPSFLTVNLTPVTLEIQPPTNLHVQTSANVTTNFNILQYDSAGNLLPGQCIQFNNTGPRYSWNLYLPTLNNGYQYTLKAGETIYFNISGPTGDSSTFSTTPCGSTAVKSLAINSKKYPNHPKYHGKAGRVLLMSTLVVLILILLGYFINKT